MNYQILRMSVYFTISRTNPERDKEEEFKDSHNFFYRYIHAMSSNFFAFHFRRKKNKEYFFFFSFMSLYFGFLSIV